MKNLLSVLTLILISVFVVSAQTTPDTSCPTVSVNGGGIVQSGEPMSFTAQVDTKGKALNLKYIWSVSGGKITSGQGELTINVQTSIPGENITATVEVEGFPEGCSNISSETQPCDLRPPSATLVDEWGNLSYDTMWARVEAFFIVLGKEPNAQGYIINYGTNREIARRETQLKRYDALRKFDASRFTFIRGGANPNGEPGAMTRVWIVPPGAVPPTP